MNETLTEFIVRKWPNIVIRDALGVLRVETTTRYYNAILEEMVERGKPAWVYMLKKNEYDFSIVMHGKLTMIKGRPKIFNLTTFAKQRMTLYMPVDRYVSSNVSFHADLVGYITPEITPAIWLKNTQRWWENV